MTRLRSPRRPLSGLDWRKIPCTTWLAFGTVPEPGKNLGERHEIVEACQDTAGDQSRCNRLGRRDSTGGLLRSAGGRLRAGQDVGQYAVRPQRRASPVRLVDHGPALQKGCRRRDDGDSGDRRGPGADQCAAYRRAGPLVQDHGARPRHGQRLGCADHGQRHGHGSPGDLHRHCL